ncbi:MAG: LacI family DNA-binding transcriptional regulator [Clostridia bacterium]|nr:LacI family DNA-binding transcriptional regulator [Clostridia bacterium]
MDKKLTIKEIAELAGVSVAAVSYTLNGKKGVSEETRKRILDTISSTNYTPNVNSRRLILKRSFNILLVIDGNDSPLNNFFYIAVINSIVKQAAGKGYNIVLATVNSADDTTVLENMLMQRNADGIIFLSDISSKLQGEIEEIGTPFVVIDSQKKAPPYPSVHADYTVAAECAVSHLTCNGHTKIAMLASDSIPEYFICTFEGYKQALSKAGLSVCPEFIHSSALDEDSVKNCIDTLLALPEPPSAIFCTSDIIAVDAMNHLQKRGYKVPDDFSVCGIDDIVLARYHFPSLTTVHIDKDAMGRLAVDMLDKLINGERVEDIVLSSCDLIVRDSVRAKN